MRLYTHCTPAPSDEGAGFCEAKDWGRDICTSCFSPSVFACGESTSLIRGRLAAAAKPSIAKAFWNYRHCRRCSYTKKLSSFPVGADDSFFYFSFAVSVGAVFSGAAPSVGSAGTEVSGSVGSVGAVVSGGVSSPLIFAISPLVKANAFADTP